MENYKEIANGVGTDDVRTIIEFYREIEFKESYFTINADKYEDYFEFNLLWAPLRTYPDNHYCYDL